MSLDSSARKSFWLAPILLVGVVAALNAQAIMQLVGIGLSLDPAELAQAPPGLARRLSPPPVTRRTSAEAILQRNPFDHATGSLLPAPSASAAARAIDATDAHDPWNAPSCDGIDVSAVAASSDVDWSFAALNDSDNKVHMLRRGDEIAGKTVYFIGADHVWLSGAGNLCQVQLFDRKKTPPPAPPARTAPASSRGPASRAAPLAADLRKGIQAVSATEFNIDRGVVDRILENQAELMRQARVMPVTENGRVVGVRLMGIRPDTLLGVLGMQNGDRLQSINGYELASPEKALEAYARLRTADKLTIQLNRAGKNMNLDYNIR